MDEVRNKKISVIGAASSGLAVAQLLNRKGAKVFVSEFTPVDKKDREYVLLQNEKIECEFGGHTDRVLDAEWVVVSPGVPGTIPILKKISGLRIPVYSEIEVASRFLKSPIIAVTGSNGKTTTTTLIGEICKRSGKPTLIAGNIGTPLSDVVDSDPGNGFAVLEISSFQAEGMKTFKPKVGLLLNLSPDHMDRYESVESYYGAKRKMLENQNTHDWLIYNSDDPEVKKLIRGLNAKPVPFGLHSETTPGAFVRNGKIVCRLDKEEEVIATDQIGIIGKHNVYNALAAVAATRLMEIPVDVIRETLREFKGVEHRLEFVREIRGVRFYNDSKATNVDSTFVALDSFKYEKVVLLAGGKHKGSPYLPLRDLVRTKVKSLVLIGQAAPLIEKDLGDLTTVVRAGSMREAVAKSMEYAKSGDVVLLSPACSSYDMFENYEDRGRQFKNEVLQLK